MDFRYFMRDFPVTFTVISINFLIFLLNQVNLFPYTFSQPGVLDPGTFLAHFSHVDFIHILMNMFVFFQISPLLEKPLGTVKYTLVILSIWIMTSFIIYPLISHFTLGFSGVMLGLLTFTIGLYYHEKQFAKELMGWLALNILIGLMPRISFWGHFGGAVAGAVTFSVYWIFWRHKTLL